MTRGWDWGGDGTGMGGGWEIGQADDPGMGLGAGDGTGGTRGWDWGLGDRTG